MAGERKPSQGKFDDYVCGGYFLAKVARDYRKSEFLPNSIVTVSNCVAETLPDQWAIEWMDINETQEQREEAASKCGIDANDLKRFIAWTTERVSREEIGITNVIFAKKTADDLLGAFTFDRTDWHLLALGLRKEKIEDFLSGLPTYQGPGSFGVHDMISRREPPDPMGDIIGYDVLGMGGCGDFHSWFCNSLEEKISKELSIRPGANGLLATYSQAETCAEYASRPNSGAEPAPWVAWHPWAVINYPI